PSTSEVYGMSPDRDFDPEQSPLVYGPIHRQRWIYACSKQLMDRVIWAYGQQEGLDFTLFRPFNWIGAGLDSISTPKEGSSRVVTQFFGHIVRGERIQLVDGGKQKRAFTYVEDGLDALMAIIANRGGIASGKIYNIGNPRNNLSVRELATAMVDLALEYPEYRDAARKVRIVRTSAERYYGRGYQDMQNRVPNIVATKRDLGFRPRFFSKVRRTSVLEHERTRTLLYGTLLRGPDIGRECADTMRATRDAGFEVGIHCWDHVRWQDNVASRDAAWTEREMRLACERFEAVFREIPRTWGAAGWQTNAHAARFQDHAGFAYASDTRGIRPF